MKKDSVFYAADSHLVLPPITFSTRDINGGYVCASRSYLRNSSDPDKHNRCSGQPIGRFCPPEHGVREKKTAFRRHEILETDRGRAAHAEWRLASISINNARRFY